MSRALRLGAAALLLLGTAPTALAASHTYQYFRFNPVKLRANQYNEMQMTEFRLRLGETDVTSSATVTAPTTSSPANEAPAYVKDGNINTKWFSFARSPLVFSFPAPVEVDNYSYATGGDADGRDTLSWTLEGSNDSATGPWTKIDVINDYPVTIDRKAWIGDFTIPAELPPEITFFTSVASVVLNDHFTEFDWGVIGTTDFTLEPEPGDVSGETYAIDITPPANKDTPFTLTATNSAASVSKTLNIRAVAGGEVTYRYVRFTPIQVRLATANPIQIADFTFYQTGNDEDPENDVEILADAVKMQGGLYTETANEGPNKLKDNSPATKWYNGTKVPVIFDLGSEQTFDNYAITTGNDFPDRDPVRWLLEGSHDELTWTRIDDISTFDYSMPLSRNVPANIPLPGGSLPPLATMTADSVKVFLGEPLTLSWTTTDAATVTIDPLPGAVAANGSQVVYPTESALYTLTATSPAGFETVRTFDVTVVDTPVTDIAYDDFDAENGELSLVGFATILNDSANIPLPADADRLRLTPDVPGRSGAAWFGKRMPVSTGFDTTFGFQMTKPVNERGADGLAFIVHDSPLGNGVLPDGENGLPDRSLTVAIDAYQNTGQPSNATLRVSTGTTVQGPVINLATTPGITINTTSTPNGLTTDFLGAPHTVRVAYVPGSLDVWFDGVQVISNLNIDLSLAGAVNPEGMAFVGFAARTGGFSQNNDVTRWHLTTGAPQPPLEISSYSFDVGTGQGTLTWSSEPGKSYRITRSVDLISFPFLVQEGIPSAGTETSYGFSFPAAPASFFRVEEEP
ncbi:lectin-like domain-containing protein [Luteolibacter marinus]|uniref:lectin-like domain-containing protein n=1 Tax=Luteolibacter marinus TaxID=2776705 RepID=UPI00186912A3